MGLATAPNARPGNVRFMEKWHVHTDPHRLFWRASCSCLRDCSIGWDNILRSFHPTMYGDNWTCYLTIPIKLNADVSLRWCCISYLLFRHSRVKQFSILYIIFLSANKPKFFQYCCLNLYLFILWEKCKLQHEHYMQDTTRRYWNWKVKITFWWEYIK